MTKREFVAAYKRTAKAYHAGDGTYERHMDDLSMKCTDAQWGAVEWASANDFPDVERVLTRLTRWPA